MANLEPHSDHTLAIFKGKNIRRKLLQGEWWFSVIDVIGAAGTPGAVAQWAIVSKIDTPIKTAWIQPSDVPVRPAPPAPSLPAYPGDAMFDKVGALLFADYAQAGRVPDPQVGRWFGRTIYDYLAGMTLEDSIKKHRAEWRSALGL